MFRRSLPVYPISLAGNATIRVGPVFRLFANFRRVCRYGAALHTPCYLLGFSLLPGCSKQLDPTFLVPTDGGSRGMLPDATNDCRELALNGRIFAACVGPPAAFAEAERGCQQRGGQLARIASAAENTALAALASEAGTQSNLWIGGQRDDEHVWSWPNAEVFWTGLALGMAREDAFVNWQSGEPNDDSTVLDEPERCAAMTLFNGTWKDRACSLELSYFCEQTQPFSSQP